MFIITTYSKETIIPSKSETFSTIEDLFSHINTLKKQNNDNEDYVFGKVKANTEEIESTQFIVLRCGDDLTYNLNDKLKDFNYIYISDIDSHIVIVPICHEINYDQIDDITLQLGALLRCENIYYNDIENQIISINTLMLAELHATNKCITLNDLPVIPKKMGNISIALSDKCIEEAREVIAYYKGNFIYTENKAFYYAQHEGIWKALSKDNFLKHLAVNYYKDSKSPKQVNQVFNALKMIAYQDSFPRCEDEHNVIAFGNCSLIPQLIKPIEHNSKHYSRHKVTYSYDPQAKCPQWKTFLRQIFGQNQDYKQKVYLLQEYMGLSLTNITKFQKMIMLIGIGSNGKSVILKVVGALVGEGNMSKVSLKDLNNKFNLVSLNGKLVNIDCDLDVDSLNSDAKFKAIVAGEEMVLENKFERTFKSLVEVKLWAAGNAFPNVKNDSHGYYRRIIPLMFTRVIEEGEENRNLDEQLLKELPGILNWALKGLKRLIKNGNFTIPQSSREALLDYKISNNSVTRFFNEKLELIDIKGSPKSGILSSELFNAYKKFSVENGFPSISDSVFGTKLKALSVNIAKSNGKRYYSVKFRDEIEDNEAEVEEEESV